MLLLVFPLSLMLCLIAGVTNYIEAVVMGKGKRNAILTILTITNPITWGLSQVIESHENTNFTCAPFELQDFPPSLITLNGVSGATCNSDKNRSRRVSGPKGRSSSLSSECGALCEVFALLFLKQLQRTAPFTVCLTPVSIKRKSVDHQSKTSLGRTRHEAVDLLTW